MAINPYRKESFSSYNDEVDLYKFQIHSNPNIKTVPFSKDTVEVSKTSKIKEEALERLTSPKYYLLMQALSKGAKVLFLTVALPPYFLFFGLPKFLIVEGLPAVVILVDWVTIKIKQKMQKPMQFAINQTMHMMALLRMMSKRIIQPVVQASIQVREYFQRMRDRILARANQLLGGVKQLLKKPGLLLSQITAGFKNQISKTFGWVSNKSKAIQDKLQERLDRIKETPHSLIAWGAAQMQKINEFRLSIVEKAASKYQLSHQAAKACHQWLGVQVQTCKQFVALALSPFLRLYQEGLKPALMSVLNVFKNAWSNAGGFVKDRRQKMVQFLDECRGRMKALNAQQFLDLVLTSSKMKNMPNFLRKILLAVQNNRFLKGLFGTGYNLVTSLIYYASSIAKTVIELVSKFYALIAKSFSSLVQSLKNVFSVIFGHVGACLGWLNKIWNKGLYAVLLVSMMFGILIRWGFQLLGEISTKAVSKLAFKGN